MKNHTPIT